MISNLEIEKDVEADSERHPNSRPKKRLFAAGHMRLSVNDANVNEQGCQYYAEEEAPNPKRMIDRIHR